MLPDFLRYEERGGSSAQAEIFYGARVHALDNIRALISRLQPEAICDQCIVERLGLAPDVVVEQAVRQLSGTCGIERRRGTCALCESEKIVSRQKS
ncbi:hypothetical protein [Sphingomonas pituitosa]|uniref:hypothetical protein n=1 Tax=Sphingomonas pituitosa TaxID=99597 RepID=UPI001FE0869B|nr:hypothetical protein [Sphingomonas pituitosa]